MFGDVFMHRKQENFEGVFCLAIYCSYYQVSIVGRGGVLLTATPRIGSFDPFCLYERFSLLCSGDQFSLFHFQVVKMR